MKEFCGKSERITIHSYNRFILYFSDLWSSWLFFLIRNCKHRSIDYDDAIHYAGKDSVRGNERGESNENMTRRERCLNDLGSICWFKRMIVWYVHLHCCIAANVLFSLSFLYWRSKLKFDCDIKCWISPRVVLLSILKRTEWTGT